MWGQSLGCSHKRKGDFMIAVCHTRCFDSVKCTRYYPGDQDDVDPLSPIALYFDFPEGTEVYHKIKAAKGSNKAPIETTRIVGGEIKKQR